MANENITESEVTAMIAELKKYPILASFGSDELNPLKGAPKAEGDIKTKDVTLYETGEEVQASYITQNNVKVTITTRNVETAITLLDGLKKGDNVFASANKKSLILAPITADPTAKTLTFAAAYLQPGLSYTPGENEDPHEVQLVFICKPDATTGKPFTYAVPV